MLDLCPKYLWRWRVAEHVPSLFFLWKESYSRRRTAHSRRKALSRRGYFQSGLKVCRVNLIPVAFE
jgi:hypothetical protein